MAITAKALRLQDLFTQGVFEPAMVQREYQWTDKECGLLFSDLFRAFSEAGFDPDPAQTSVAEEVEEAPLPAKDAAKLTKTAMPERALVSPDRTLRAKRLRAKPKDYFLGPVVLLASSPGRFAIYDGLQRFTTLSILFATLRDTFNDDPERWLDLQQMLRTSDGEMAPRIRAATPAGTLATITSVFRGTRPEQWRVRTKLSEADANMRAACALFHDCVSDWSDKRRQAFVSFLREHIYVTLTQVEDRSLAYRIFVSANDRGKSLEVGDILKGQLVEIVSQDLGVARADRAAGLWQAIDRSVHPHFDDLLRALDFLDFGDYRSNDFGEELLNQYDREGGGADICAWIEEELPAKRDDFLRITAHAKLKKVTGVDVTFRQLSFLDWKEWQAVAMALAWRYSADEPAFALSIKLLQRACYVFTILNLPAADRSAESAEAIGQIREGLNPFAGRDEEGRYGALHFSASRKAKARGLLENPIPEDSRHGPIMRMYETLYWGDALPSQPISGTSVEHVLPRFASGPWLEAFTSESDREACTNMLGNFCLLPKDIDGRLGHSPFADKKLAYRALPKEYKSAHEIGAHDKWTPETVKKRTKIISAKLIDELGIKPAAARAPAKKVAA